MADDDGLVDFERVENSDHVSDEVKERVLFDLFGTVGLPKAAHVRRDPSVSGLRQRKATRSVRIVTSITVTTAELWLGHFPARLIRRRATPQI